MSTLFSRIIQGEIPSYKIYEDELTYVFLDINQFHRGKILIVPKIEVDHFFDLDDIYYQAIFNTAKKLAPILKKTFESQRVWLVIEWLEVPHAHLKLFPVNKAWDIWDNDELILTHEEMLEIKKLIISQFSYA